MLRRCVPLHNDHLYLTDSGTESDDLLNVQRSNRGIYMGKQRCKINRNNMIDGEGKGKAKAKAKAKAFKAKSGIKISNPFSLGIYLGMITTP